MSLNNELDCSKATTENPIAGCDLHSQIMSGPPKADAAAPQKIIIQVEMAQPAAPPEPDHIKVHHNIFSKVGHAVGHFGKEYALGVRDSIEPRNLGRMTLPVGIGVGTQLIVAHQLAMGIKGGFNQVGAGMNKLGAGEAQLGAGQVQMAQQMAGMQQEITALEGAKTGAAMARGLGAVHEASGVAPHIGASVRAGSEISASFRPVDPIHSIHPIRPIDPIDPVRPVGPARPIGPIRPIDPIRPVGPARPIGRIEEIAPENTSITISGASVAPAAIGSVISGRPTIVADSSGASRTAAAGMPVETATANDTFNAPNVGIDSRGFAVPMTPKQVAKAREYQDSVTTSETQLKNGGDTFQTQLSIIAGSMASSPYAAAFINDLQMRHNYAVAYDQADDHKGSRAYLSDCKQDTDNLKRLAKAEHNYYAEMQIDALKRTVNQLDDVEKHFHKRPNVVLAANTDQANSI